MSMSQAAALSLRMGAEFDTASTGLLRGNMRAERNAPLGDVDKARDLLPKAHAAAAADRYANIECRRIPPCVAWEIAKGLPRLAADGVEAALRSGVAVGCCRSQAVGPYDVGVCSDRLSARRSRSSLPGAIPSAASISSASVRRGSRGRTSPRAVCGGANTSRARDVMVRDLEPQVQITPLSRPRT